MKLGAAYIRVSTDDQMEFSPDSQLHKICAYAKSNDIIIPDDYVFMEDEGRSGRSAKSRPEFQRMIGTAKLKPKPFDVILVWKFSRFARNREDSIVYKSMLRKQHQIDVVSVSENVGDDKMSILIEAIIEAMDEWYSVNLAEEVRRGMAEKASRGGVVGSPAYGYQAKGGQLVSHPDEATIVRLIFDKYVNEGIGCKPLAEQLNAMGVRSKKGHEMQNRIIQYILKNPVYIGKIKWNTKKRVAWGQDYDDAIIADGSHEPLVSPELFEAAQARLAETKKRFPKYARAPQDNAFMLKGLVRCSACGASMVRSGIGLQCHQYAKGACSTSHYISRAQINIRVTEYLEDAFHTKDFDLTVRVSESNSVNSDIARAQIEKEQRKLIRIKEAFQSGIDTIEEYRENKAKITSVIASLEETTVVPKKARDFKKEFLKKNQNLVSILRDPQKTEAEKNNALRSCVDRIVFSRPKNQLKFFFYL